MQYTVIATCDECGRNLMEAPASGPWADPDDLACFVVEVHRLACHAAVKFRVVKLKFAQHQPPGPMRMCRTCLHPDDQRCVSFRYTTTGPCFACRKPTTAFESTAVDKAVAGEDRLANMEPTDAG